MASLRTNDKQLKNVLDAKQVFTQLLKKKDIPEALALECDKPLLPILQDALALLNKGNLALPMQLLAALGQEKLSHGIYAELVLETFYAYYKAPGFMEAMKADLQSNSLGDPAALAWMLMKLGAEKEEVRQCKNEVVNDIVEMLLQSKAPGMDPIAPQLATVFAKVDAPAALDVTAAAPESLQTAKHAMRPPGVRDHDNDHEDFRSISILPTTTEVSCPERPYLPPVEGSSFIGDREAAILDRLFRLSREDFMGSLREEMAEELKADPKDYRQILPGPKLVGIAAEGARPCVLLTVPVPNRLKKRIKGMSKKDAQDFFNNGPGRRVLGQDTLVLLMEPGDKSESSSTQPQTDGAGGSLPPLRAVAVGVVTMRFGKQWSMLQPGSAELQVGVSFPGCSSLEVVTKRLDGIRGYNKSLAPTLSPFLFNASTGYFTYEPVLRSLQQMTRIPLGSTLAHMQHPGPPLLPHGGRSLTDFSEELQQAVRSDKPQSTALELLFSSEVTLVQGPPGTGKTYVGVQMVKAMLEASSKWGAGRPLRILCLCYTNHALDSFLESLIDAGIPDTNFIRLGSSFKISERLKPRCLRELKEGSFNQGERRCYAMLKTEQEHLCKDLEELKDRLGNRSHWGTTEAWWRIITDFLEDEFYAELEQLTVQQDNDDDDGGSSGHDGGFRVAGANSKEVKPNYLWERWCSGKDRGAFRLTTQGYVVEDGVMDLWAMSPEERKAQKEEWNSAWLGDFHRQMASVMQRLSKNAQMLQDLRLETQSRVLKDAKIIGATTVGAAKLRGMLREVAPDVVLVEEAGEILEAQVLSTIGNSCKQLILIGDHLQLRPKTECFALRKESGNGLDHDVSGHISFLWCCVCIPRFI